MFSPKHNTQANIVDGALVASFIAADGPRVWRFDMAKFVSTALEIRESQDGFSLIMKAGHGPEDEVGHFPNKKKAMEAMELITAALLRGHEAAPAPKSSGGFLKFLKFVLFLLVLASLFVVWNKRDQMQLPESLQQAVTAPAPAPTPAPEIKPGVPMPADEMFGK